MLRAVAPIVLTLMLAAVSSRADAQRAGQTPRIQPSGRAATALCFSSQCRLTDTSTITVLIEYGQPHARGRRVWETLEPLDSVSRLGANTATHLVTRVPLTLGQTRVPAGKYTLHFIPGATSGQLIVSDTTNVWGVPYVGAAKDLARIPMRSRNLSENIESLEIALVPSTTTQNSGVLSVIWGRREFSVDWAVRND